MNVSGALVRHIAAVRCDVSGDVHATVIASFSKCVGNQGTSASSCARTSRDVVEQVETSTCVAFSS